MSKLNRFTNGEQLSLEDLLAEAGLPEKLDADQASSQATPGSSLENLVYYVFRPGKTGQRIPKLSPEEVLAQALPVFREQFGRAPCAVACHPTWAEAVQAALNGNGDIPVIPVGGCLVPELWLALPEGKGRG